MIDYKKSDELRNKIERLGFTVIDRKDGTSYISGHSKYYIEMRTKLSKEGKSYTDKDILEALK